MTFYAQNQEDVILWQALQNIRHGCYVDVGAGHPVNISVTKIFYDTGHWDGINIEPNGEMYRLLQQQRPRDINLCVCAGPKSGTETFMYYDGGVGIVANNPRIRDIFERHGHHGSEALLGQASLNDIFKEYLGRDTIHFLKIDVEGYEGEVLQGLDLKRYRPWIIVAEAILPSTYDRTDEPWTPYLLDNDYRFIYFDGQNCFFLAVERIRDIRTGWALEK